MVGDAPVGILEEVPESPELLEIAVRGYAVPVRAPRTRTTPTVPTISPSEWSVVWDTETTADAAQQLRVGVFQLRRGDQLIAEGVFADQPSLSKSNRAILARFVKAEGIELCS